MYKCGEFLHNVALKMISSGKSDPPIQSLCYKSYKLQDVESVQRSLYSFRNPEFSFRIHLFPLFYSRVPFPQKLVD